MRKCWAEHPPPPLPSAVAVHVYGDMLEAIARARRGTSESAVSSALASGALRCGPCEVCGEGRATRLHAHHDDYNAQVSVRWLCAKHHAAWHRDFEPVYVNGWELKARTAVDDAVAKIRIRGACGAWRSLLESRLPYVRSPGQRQLLCLAATLAVDAPSA